MKQDERAAFEAFVAASTSNLMRTAVLLTRHPQEAEDLVASTLERTARHWPKVMKLEQPAGLFARRVLVNLSTDRWRQLARRPSRGLSPSDEQRPSSEDLAHDAVVRDQVKRLLVDLPSRQRACLVLRYYEDLPDAEIARILGCSTSSVKSQISRGLSRLRESALEPDQDPLKTARTPR